MKRVFDFWVSVFLIFILSPLFFLVAIMVRFRLGPPVIYRQQRPGFQSQPFMIYKFRSLTDQRDRHGNLLPDSERFTRFGSWLRRSSLDELPELINVLKGDMSLVGPRPLLMQYIDRYTEFQARRHEVRPGITGWAQINGRNAVSWEKKFQMDVWYIDHQSFLLDIKILFLTLIQVYKRQGIHQEGHVTTEEFMGTTNHG